ncbi:MAG: hypothetical protein H0U95_05085 [Bacteroidetes bacterium]|nr:hypothetical protein [Bacteroidota bacterium]
MPTTQPIPTSEAFRFAALRPAIKKRRIAIDIGFVTFAFFDAIPAPTLSAIEASEPLLYKKLKSHLGSPTARADMEKDVDAFKLSPNYISDEKTLNTRFPNLDLVIAVMEDSRKGFNTIQLKNKIETVLGTSINAFVTNADFLNKKLRLWDNLFALMVKPSDDYLRELLINFIKALRLMERINVNDELLKDGGIKKAVESTIILPEPLFPLPKIINVLPEINPTPIEIDPEIGLASEKITALQNAKTDVNEVFNLQLLSLKRKSFIRQADPNAILSEAPRPNDDPNTASDIPQDNMYLSDAAYSQLKDATKLVLNTLRISQSQSHIQFINEIIDDELRKQGKVAYSNYVGESMSVRIGGNYIEIRNYCLDAEISNPCDPYTGVSLPKGSGKIKPAGIADLLLVKQQLLKYSLGEIAHVENIMLTEKKARTFRQLNREESTFTTETETTREQERDTQTTERFGVEKESSNIIQEDQSLEAGITISASYGGMITLTAGVNYATSSSSISSTSVATQYAKSVTERAVERIKERVRSSKTIITISETEETNLHEFDNTNTASPTASHVIGQYHWLDKFYLNQLVNYGKRLMFEFVIPEPAAFYIFSKLKKPDAGTTTPIPTTLAENKIQSHKDITIANFGTFISIYGVQGINSPPPQFQTVSTTITNPVSNGWSVFGTKDLKVPTGYLAKMAYATVGSDWGSAFIMLRIGRHSCGGTVGNLYSTPLDNETDLVPVTGFANYKNTAYINIEIVCERSPELFEEWQLKTYQAIVEAYNKKKSDYENALKAAQTSAGVTIYGNNPEINREIEKTEIKKGCIELLTDQKFDAFDAMRTAQPTQNYPEFRNIEAKAEGDYIKFFEQAFEWSQMTYIFYPYFWGRKSQWLVNSLMSDNDPLFTSFLKAGAVRVLVPVRTNFTEAALYYTESGNIWNGAGVPTIGDPLYVSIIDEIKTATGDLVGTNVGDPWITKLPTNLVKLAAGIDPALPDNSVALGV